MTATDDALDKLEDYANTPIESDFDFIKKMTFGIQVLDTIEEKLERVSRPAEKRSERIASMKGAAQHFAKRDYRLLKKLHYEEAQLRVEEAEIQKLSDVAEHVEDMLYRIEDQARYHLGYLPHDFFED